MSLTPGACLGPYEITALLGEGGMGQVYRARDTKLDRDVAVKVLPESFAGDAERLARFTREAKTLAALNHPNIAQIYGIEESSATRALVMELVDGEDLSTLIARAPLPTSSVLAIARQIAEALEAAHEQGIIHRDLKPANVKVRADGTVKVLDFGLAKAVDPAGASSASASALANSPTITSPAMTQMGMILGTAAYMSPEQARGRAVDKRADIWAFGCVLYEMLTGRRLFDAEDVSETLAAVLTREVNLSALPAETPLRLHALVRDCLIRDPKQRLRDIGEARRVLDTIQAGTSDDALGLAAAAGPPRSVWRRVLPWVASVAGMLAVGAAAWTLKPEPVRTVARFSIPLPEGQAFTGQGRQLVAVSPDGTNLVYVASQRLYLRALDGLEPREIPGSGSSDGDGAFAVAFSPDGQSVAFFADGALKRLTLAGGVPARICEVATALFGLSWDDSGIVFAQEGKGILRVSASGGDPEVIVPAGAGEQLANPHILPGGRAVLFATNAQYAGWDGAKLVVQRLDGGARTTVVEGASDGRYLPTGHLAYAVDGVLLAVPFDPDRLVVTGDPVPLVEGVRRTLGPRTSGPAQFSYSSTGVLAFVPGPAAIDPASTGLSLVLFDRQGHTQSLGPRGPYLNPRVSRDGKFVVFNSLDSKGAAVWVYAMDGATAPRQLTFEGRSRYPIWSPDGQFVAFQSDREGDLAIFRQGADGSSAAERLTKPEPGAEHVPQAFSPDGAHLLYSIRRNDRWTLWTLTMKDRAVTAFGGVQSTGLVEGAFSPDGRWVAYQESDRESVGRYNTRTFLQPFPATGAKYLVAVGGHPYWSPKGDQLILNVTGNLSRIFPITTSPAVAVGQPIDLPRTGHNEPGPSEGPRQVDALPDGMHFVGISPGRPPVASAAAVAATAASPPDQQITVVLNWFDEVRRLVPTK